MITVNKIGGRTETSHIEFVGNSTDNKPIDGIVNGSIFIEIDTQNSYMFNEENSTWVKIKQSGGSGGVPQEEVDEGKTLIANAITDKGVETSKDDSFETMADNIGLISNGIDTNKMAYWYSSLADQKGTSYQGFRMAHETSHIAQYNSTNKELEALKDCFVTFSFENDHSSSYVTNVVVYKNGEVLKQIDVATNSYVFETFELNIGDKIQVYMGAHGWCCMAVVFVEK